MHQTLSKGGGGDLAREHNLLGVHMFTLIANWGH